ncbi:MAG: dihydroneopterin aldolase [Sediminibacterium sp.]|jgi:dihydroneopterin aldolase
MHIYLNDLIFNGFHGVYPAEKKIGNTFKLDLRIQLTPTTKTIDQLEQTIDYVQVYALIQKIMAVPTPLLETIVTNIADQILAAHPMAESVYVKITKQQLSVPYFQGTTAVDIERTRSNYSKSNASI